MHPTITGILEATKNGRMDKGDLAKAIALKHNMGLDWGFNFIDEAIKDGVVRPIQGVIYTTIELV